MGVDITAYRDLSKSDMPVEEFDYQDGFVRFDNMDCFAERATDIDTKAVYQYGEAIDVLSRSYSGYGVLREQLAKVVGYPLGDEEPTFPHSSGAWAASSGPFWELIMFADNEGTLGTETCRKLAADFAEHQAKAEQVEFRGFIEFYNAMRRGCEFAAHGGAIRFS